MTQTVPQDVKDMVADFYYREYFKLSVAQAEREPWEAKWLARTIWALRAEKSQQS